jgi:hypothetical protein
LTFFDLLATFVTGVGEWPGSMAFDDVNVVVQFLGIKGFLLGRRHRKTLAAFSSVFSRICSYSTGVEGQPLLPERMA